MRGSPGGNRRETAEVHCRPMEITAFAAGGWWVGYGVTAAGLAVLAGLVIAVVTTVNGIERRAASIVFHLDAAAVATRPLLDLVETNEALAALAQP